MQATILTGGKGCRFFALLMYILIAKNKAVYSYHNAVYWLYPGKPDDYTRSIEEFERHKDRFLS